ncbi:hypothetical protein JKF63_06252 [Porcisia hertigi]|uniref:Uncharacterized protein n=1 Tax=Porcisia hertigi TaxID=2761500 RepID=A0A836I1B3_9TRYP|nr:hypothetical protein JKF63_06252 [Porcisia hertigi]
MASALKSNWSGSPLAVRGYSAEAQWAGLAEVQRLLAAQPNEKELFAKYTVVRSVVGEVQPVYDDSVCTRIKVLCEDPAFTMAEDSDDFEPVSIHVVAYFNETLFKEDMGDLMVQARLLRSIGMEGSGLRFQRRERRIVPSDDERRAEGSSGSSSGGKPSVQGRMYSPNYRPERLIPVGTIRLRRVSKTPETGKLGEVVAKIERMCVVKGVRCFGVDDMLMKEAERIAQYAFHVRWALIYALPTSKNFYTKLLYAPKDKQAGSGVPTPSIVMVKCLVNSSM